MSDTIHVPTAGLAGAPGGASPLPVLPDPVQADAIARTAGTGPSLLLDLRPCYEGFAGIPQEARLLFAMFSRLPLRRFGGLASGIHYTSRRTPMRTPYERTLAQTRVLISQDTRRTHWLPGFDLLPNFIKRRIFRPYLSMTEVFRREKLDLRIDPKVFHDYLWMKLFDRTLASKDRDILSRAEFFAAELGHEYARSLTLLPRIFERQVDTHGWDIFFAMTVSPYRLAPGTKKVIRYYDALPLVSPHTVGEPWPHALSHARMLKRNMDDGAIFYCDSEPVREDVLQLFPEAEQRVHTIPAMIAPEYRPDVRSETELRGILMRRASPATEAARKIATQGRQGSGDRGAPLRASSGWEADHDELDWTDGQHSDGRRGRGRRAPVGLRSDPDIVLPADVNPGDIVPPEVGLGEVGPTDADGDAPRSASLRPAALEMPERDDLGPSAVGRSAVGPSEVGPPETGLAGAGQTSGGMTSAAMASPRRSRLAASTSDSTAAAVKRLRRMEPRPLPRLIMAVSTLEPRKNYLKLFQAFEVAREMTRRPMQLLIVANPGWRSEAELAELKVLVREGAFHLSGVPLAELRVLYSMAHCVVAPSRAEGFDYSGVEAMACGTPVLASGIPVHRWVYGDAAEYFDPYDENELARLLAAVIELPRNEGRLAALRERGLKRAALYGEEALAPRWQAALEEITVRSAR